MGANAEPVTYTMLTQTDCGPAAVSWVLFVLGLFASWDSAYGHVTTNWPGEWSNHGDIRDDLNDQCDDARLVIEQLGRHQTMVTLTDILSGKYPADTVVVLVHFSHTAKHWVVWHETTNSHVRCHWGDGKIHDIQINDFVDLFTASMPNCAYTVTPTKPRLSWWQRMRRRVLGWLARRT